MKHTYIEETDVGNRVVCDVCDEDYTNSPECGGFLFQSYAYCPKCAPKQLKLIKRYNEEHFIKAHCPPNMAFAKWVLSLRGGDNTIRVITTRDE